MTPPPAAKRSACICEDISFGMENKPIPVFNEVDDDTSLPRFRYIKCLRVTKDVMAAIFNAAKSPDKSYMPFSHDPMPATEVYVDPGNGGLATGLRMLSQRGISEVGAPQNLRIVTRGVHLPLEVFKTEVAGWGVRCRERITAGTFICEYGGEVIPFEIAEAREQHTSAYLFELNHFHRSLPLVLEATEERMGCKIDPITRRGIESRCMAAHLKPLSIDAIECGNVARFINNRDIEPNCGVQPVLTAQNHSTIFYSLAIFAIKDIPAGAELNYCYGYNNCGEGTELPDWYRESCGLGRAEDASGRT
uniref:SET domain-containing protein n=1 Tax=Tetraselmis chuii TaxID=63592 RepID=A0A7S1WZH9_9CHLO|mmetsp:Transcript_13029/g.23212  ORF Transcript_13029/g.23212 Transcript_13029/m.23212 type:complete len:306 (+) Transcript_13029:193-1110(+)